MLLRVVGSLVVLGAVNAFGTICGTAVVNYSYLVGGARHSNSVRIPIDDAKQTPEMKATFFVVSAGRTIQTLLKDWHSGAQSPSFSVGETVSPAVSTSPSIGGIALLPPPTPDQPQTTQVTRGKRFAETLRQYIQKWRAQTRALTGLNQPLPRQLYALDNDLEKLAKVWENAHEYSYGYRSKGGLEALESFSAGPSSLESAGSPMQLASGGTMSDSSFWAQVDAQQIPELDAFPMEGFLKRFRLGTHSPALPDKWKGEPAYAFGDALFLPESQRLLIQLGMNSGLDETTYVRPPLNLVVALDISGSMSASDSVGSSTRLEGAKRALGDLLSQLKPGDRLSLVAFDEKIDVLAENLRIEAGTSTESLMQKIRALQPRGGTDINNVQRTAYSMLNTLSAGSVAGSQSRVVLITDAQATVGELNGAEMENSALRAGSKNQYTTVIGVGRDFSLDLSARLANAPGGMFFHASNGDELYKLFAQFDTRMVTFGAGFDASLTVEGMPGTARVVAVYGSGVSDPSKETLPPGTTVNGQTVLNVPTLAFADRRSVDPDAGGGAFVVEVQFTP